MALPQIPIPKERNLYLAKQVDQESINEITKAIIDINDDDADLIKLAELHGMVYKPKPIMLYIDSYGRCGSCYSNKQSMYYIELDYTPPTEEQKEEMRRGIEEERERNKGRELFSYHPVTFEPIFRDELAKKNKTL